MDHNKHQKHHGDHGSLKLDKKLETMLKYGFVVIAALLLINVWGVFQVNQNLTFLGQALVAQGGGGSAQGTAPTQAAPTPQRPAAPSPTVEVSDDGDPFIGADPDTAKVVIIEFSDFQCPFCGRFYTQTLPSLKQKYIEGRDDVSFVYRDFPLSFHPQAQSSAEAAECANEQGKFWEFHDLLFDNQRALNPQAYKQWAGQLGLNQAQFDQCLDSSKYRDEVQKDFRDGQAAGVSGTPTVFINGNRIVGAQPAAAFEQAIEAELAK